MENKKLVIHGEIGLNLLKKKIKEAWEVGLTYRINIPIEFQPDIVKSKIKRNYKENN